ncbi:MAG: signal recognition particle-docking protein FtsY [Candidatus Thermoplasmatota archaeon]|jgi:fused signal recognition particle receptor|nr:signal recognition particle-docking protein FtsY [Candidatus Thermoplasmatota archaeon]
MFNALKEKLNIFKKKAKEDLEDGGAAPEPSKIEGAQKKKESKFLKKLFSRKDKDVDHDLGPKSGEGDGDISLRTSMDGSGLAGEAALKGEGSLLEDSGGLFGKRISEGKLGDVLYELELALLESDVAQPVVERIKSYMMDELTGVKVSRGTDLDQAIAEALRSAIRKVLSVKTIDFDGFIKTAERPTVLMFVGVNGTGKTTAIARIAYRLKNNGYSCILAAGDTFRAGAIEQLEKHAQKLDLKLIKHKAGADPAAVAFDAVEHAKARRKDVVLLDTAGRMQTNINLMDEMKKIKRVAKPTMIVYVGDSLAGNDAIIQAQKFDEAVGIDGVILTKIDADAKGGAALSIAYTIGKPILFVGTGQGYPDLTPFDPDWMTARLFEE